MTTRNKKIKDVKVEQPITPKTRKKIINKLVEEDAKTFDAKEEKFLESTVEEIEAQPVDVTDEEIVAQEEFINEPVQDEIDVEIADAVEEFKNLPDVQSEDIKETLEKFHNVDAEAEMTKLLEASAEPLKFQKDYFLINDGKPMTTPIDTLPEEPVKVPEKQERKRKTFAQMTSTEMNIYHKTGIIPFC